MRTLKSTILLIFFASLSIFANEITVRSFPDGYRDDGKGSIFSDHPHVLALYTWASKKGFMGQDVKIALSMPKGLEITRFSVTRKPRKYEAIKKVEEKNGMVKYVVTAGKVPFTSVYKLSKHSWRPTVPWTDSVLIFFVKPSKELPREFTVDWSITGKNVKSVSGKMRLYTMKAPKLAFRPKNKMIWGGLGAYREAWDMENLKAVLKTYYNIGITGVRETGGAWFPEKLIKVSDLHKYGFKEKVAMQVFGYSQRKEIADMQKAGFAVTEKDCVLDAAGKRQIRHRGRRTYNLNIYCITSIGLKDSPVRGYMRDFYSKYIQRGFTHFFTDYEPTPYDNCYCKVCREEYAKFAGFDKAECLKLSPGELVAKDPWKWYKFRCYTYARVLGLLKKELNIKIGWNSNLGADTAYMPEFKGYGMVYFAEDPRLFDKYLDFHSADVLGTSLNSVYAVESFMQKRSDGVYALQKPVIARATSLHWVNWGFHCIYGRKDFGIKKGFQGLGVDFRRKLHRLEIAQDFAIGVQGVELQVDLFSTDAAALTGITEGINFVGEFEKYLVKENRIDREKLHLYDNGPQSVKLQEREMKKGYLSNWFLAHHKKWKNGQIVAHKGKDYALFSLFNWNYFEELSATFTADVFPDGKFYANISCNGEKYSLPGQFDAAMMKKDGMSLILPKGNFATVLFTRDRKYPVKNIKMAVVKRGKEIIPYINGKINEGTKPFYRNYNGQMRALKKKYPTAGFREVEVR